MSRLEEIKNDWACELHFESWEMMRHEAGVDETDLDEISKRYAYEVAQASLEKASESAEVNCNHDDVKKEFTDEWSNYLYFVNKESITNPENIILL